MTIERGSDRDSLLQAVRSAGLRLAEQQPMFDRFGILKGEIEEASLGDLREVRGVVKVEAIGKKHTLD